MNTIIEEINGLYWEYYKSNVASHKIPYLHFWVNEECKYRVYYGFKYKGKKLEINQIVKDGIIFNIDGRFSNKMIHFEFIDLNKTLNQMKEDMTINKRRQQWKMQ